MTLLLFDFILCLFILILILIFILIIIIVVVIIIVIVIIIIVLEYSKYARSGPTGGCGGSVTCVCCRASSSWLFLPVAS